jgi:hypothetical protein
LKRTERQGYFNIGKEMVNFLLLMSQMTHSSSLFVQQFASKQEIIISAMGSIALNKD